MRIRSTHRRAVAALGAIALAISLAACAPDNRVDVDTPAQATGQLADDTLQQLQTAVTQAMTATGSSGAIVGVWVPWSGTWVAGLGTQAPGDKTKVSADMTFRVGDVTRAMVCDALYRAVDRGDVALGDSVTKWVSGVPDLQDVTLLQLCNGTSGLGSYQARIESMWLANPERVWQPMEIASFGLGRARTGEPGQRWGDSDTGYVLLGLALSRATGKSVSDLLHDDVFAPLGLASTQLPTGSGQWADGDALEGTLSTKDAKGVLNCAEPMNVSHVSTTTGGADSGVVSTITDLGLYTQALATGALTGSDTAKKRWANELPPYSGAPSWYTTAGGAFHAGTLIGQHSAVPGYLTAAYADPETGLAVAVVLNNSAAGGSMAFALALELAAIASKAPAASGQTAPQFGLPWTAEQYAAAIAKGAVCTAPSS